MSCEILAWTLRVHESGRHPEDVFKRQPSQAGSWHAAVSTNSVSCLHDCCIVSLVSGASSTVTVSGYLAQASRPSCGEPMSPAGHTMEGTRLTIVKFPKQPHAYEFSIRTPVTPSRWAEFDQVTCFVS